jgi:hypothetical protein
MSEFIKCIFFGTEILFGNESVKIKRNKALDVKKELKIAKSIKKTTVLQRSSNRIRKIATEALS